MTIITAHAKFSELILITYCPAFKLVCPFSRTNYGSLSFLVSSVRLWNGLPYHIVSVKSLTTFKSLLCSLFYIVVLSVLVLWPPLILALAIRSVFALLKKNMYWHSTITAIKWYHILIWTLHGQPMY